MTPKRGSLAAHVYSAVSVLDLTDVEPETVAAAQEAQEGSESCDVPSHVKEVFEKVYEELGESDKPKFAQVLQDFGDVFSSGPEDLGRTH